MEPEKSSQLRHAQDPFAAERKRIEFLVQRDGMASAQAWVHRTMGIYRRAVLDQSHYASTREYRPAFIRFYCAFKFWLAWSTARSLAAPFR